MTPKDKEYIQQLRNTIGRLEIMVEAGRITAAANELIFLRNQAMDYRSFLTQATTEKA